MEVELYMYFIVCPLVFLAGFVDAIAGGGGMISLPAYLLAGIPAHASIATNKMSSAIGTAVSTWRYCKKGYVDWIFAIPSVILALAGSYIGASLALLTKDAVLKVMLLVVLPIVAVYVLKNKSFEPSNKLNLSRKSALALGSFFAFAIGVYDGFYGPGTGTFLLLLFTGVLGMDVLTASGNVKLVNLSSNIAALVTFLLNGKVVISLGLVAAVFSIAGHYAGSGMVMKNGTKIVRPIILIVILLLFIKILTGM